MASHRPETHNQGAKPHNNNRSMSFCDKRKRGSIWGTRAQSARKRLARHLEGCASRWMQAGKDPKPPHLHLRPCQARLKAPASARACEARGGASLLTSSAELANGMCAAAKAATCREGASSGLRVGIPRHMPQGPCAPLHREP